MRKLSKLVILMGVVFLIFGWSGISLAEYEVFFVPSFQDSFTTTRPEIRIKFPRGGEGPTKVAIDTLKRCANEPYYGFVDSTAKFIDSIYYRRTSSPYDTIVRAGFGDSMYQTDESNVLCLFWDGYAALPARDSASGKPAYALKVDSTSSTQFRYPLTPCKNNISRAGELVVKPAHKSTSGYTNRTPIFQAEFSIFKEVKGDTTWYDGVFFDTNLTVVLKATGITDTLYDYKRFPQLRPGLIGNLRKVHPGKMVFTISWLDTSYYLPLDVTKAYIDSVTGGVWEYQDLSIICGSPPGYSFRGVADTFWVDGDSPEMELQEMNYVSKSPYFLLSASDAKAGVNTDSLFVDLYKVELYGEAPPDDSVEDRSYVKSLQVEGLDPSLGSVLLNTGVELEDVEGGMALDIWVFNGRPFDVNEYMTNLDAVYPDSLGPMDQAGNLIGPLHKRFYVDGIAPNVRLSSSSTHQNMIFEISDTSSCYQVDTLGHVEILCSGVNTASVKLYEDFQLVSPDSTKYNSSSGVYSVHYSPTSENVWLNLDVADKVGNMTAYQNYYEDDQLSLVEPHNYPNPFSPVSPIIDHRRTVIDPGLTRTTDMELTIDIYDLAGHHVASVIPERTTGGKIVGYWDGKTDDGTLVANGVYLCYIQARDTAQNKSLTEVIKIAVVKNDKRIF